jgi:hypothetical protein
MEGERDDEWRGRDCVPQQSTVLGVYDLRGYLQAAGAGGTGE